MIFVTVGSYKFDALVQAVDQLVAQGRIREPVTVQIGNGTYIPSHCQHFRSADSLVPYFKQADVVVGHGGTGTTLEVLEVGAPLVSVSNRDLADDHQHEFLAAMTARTGLAYCRDLAELGDAIDAARRQERKPFLGSSLRCALVRDLVDFAEQAALRA